MAPRKAKNEPWFAKYLRREIRRIWQWSPARKAAKKRATDPDGYQSCEDCGKQGLQKGEYEVDHIEPCENVKGFDGWGPFIDRTLDVKAAGLKVLCKPCHYTKSAEENRIRRMHKNDTSGRTD